MESNRENQVKLSYLNEEIKRLNEKLVDYEEMLKLNKDALKSALNIQIPEDASRKTQDSNPIEEDSQSTKALKTIITKLEKENFILSNNLEKLNKEWSISQSRVLINEQIAEAAHKHELEVIKDYEKKIKNLFELVSKKEQRIEELEKTKPTFEQEGLIIQNRDIISPNEKVMRLHNELEVQKWALIKIAKEMAKSQDEKKELLTINYNMANEITKLKSSRKLSTSPKNQEMPAEIEPSNNDAILDFHKKFLNESSGDSNQGLSPHESPLPDKITNSAQKKPLKIPMKTLNIPKLDLTQAKKIQEINAKKITPQPNMNNVDIQIQEKYKSMENELAKTKKMLQKEMCQNKMSTLELDNSLKENKNLKVKNETIMNLHKSYEEKWEKISHNYKFFQEFYRNCLLKAFQKGLSKGFLEFFHFYFPHTSLEKLYENHDNFHNFIDPTKINNEGFDERLIDLEVSAVFESNPLDYEKDGSIAKEKYIKYLTKLANDLANNYKSPPEILKKVDINNNMKELSSKQYLALPLKGRIKRSLSNTIEYMASNKKSEFNKLFMFYNQEIIDYSQFKKLMQPKNIPLYYYGNEMNNQEEELMQSQKEWIPPNENEENNYQNIGENN